MFAVPTMFLGGFPYDLVVKELRRGGNCYVTLELVPIQEVLQDVLALLACSKRGAFARGKKRPEASLVLCYESQNVVEEEVRVVRN